MLSVVVTSQRGRGRKDFFQRAGADPSPSWQIVVGPAQPTLPIAGRASLTLMDEGVQFFEFQGAGGVGSFISLCKVFLSGFYLSFL